MCVLRINFGQRLFQILALLFEDAPMLAEYVHVMEKLSRGIARAVVHIDQAEYFSKRQPQALATQRQLQTGAIARMINTRKAITTW